MLRPPRKNSTTQVARCSPDNAAAAARAPANNSPARAGGANFRRGAVLGVSSSLLLGALVLGATVLFVLSAITIPFHATTVNIANNYDPSSPLLQQGASASTMQHTNKGANEADKLNADSLPRRQDSGGSSTPGAAAAYDPSLSPLRRQQIDNYLAGIGLIVNIHVTHCGGTSMCDFIGRALGRNATPPHACMQHDKNIQPQKPSDKSLAAAETPVSDYPEFKYPWGDPGAKRDTDKNIAIVRRFYHMV